MHRMIWHMAALVLALALCCGAALAEEHGIPEWEQLPAEDITWDCLLNGLDDFRMLRDGDLKTAWDSVLRDGLHRLIITPPEGKVLGGVLIRWTAHPFPLKAQVREGDAWRTLVETEGQLYAEYIPLGGAADEVRILGRDNERKPLHFSEIRIMTPGELPPDMPLWQLPDDKVDLMIVSAHPDDEVLWFGGMIPTYAADKEVLVVCSVTGTQNRRQELLDCLWACGVRIQPVFLCNKDVTGSSLDRALAEWGAKRVIRQVAEVYRTYRPDVVALHDVNGEYGHSVHMAISYAGREAVALAADPSFVPEDRPDLAPWDVPKVYVHLQEENQIRMDWNKPLPAFDGQTALDVARLGFTYHTSQREKRWQHWTVEDGGKYDNSLFGLYHTTVGLDEMKNDLFEHIE